MHGQQNIKRCTCCLHRNLPVSL